MRCIAANRSVLTALDQNATLPDDNGNSDYTAMTNDINNKDIIQFADGWYSYPDLNTFDSDLLLNVLTVRNMKVTKVISPWNIKAENTTALPLTEIATRQLEALFNLSQLLFGLARAEQSNYTFRDLQLGHPPKRFDPRLRCVKQKSLDLLTNVSTITEIARFILDRYAFFLPQLIQGIRDGHLIEEKIPSLSVLVRLCKVIVEKNLLNSYQHLIDMQLIDILIDLFEDNQYKSDDCLVYFIKFESFALQCLQILLQCAEHVDMWSEKAQIRLVNYCCTLLYKSVLDDDQHRTRELKINHIVYAEKHGIGHSLGSGILTFLSIIRCRKEIGRFYRENEHFRELLNVMKEKYSGRNEMACRDPSISYALDQLVSIMFDRHARKKKRSYHYSMNEIQEKDENRHDRKCSNSLCQMIENDKIQFEDCPYCHKMSYCSQYCREVHWTLNHNLSCLHVNSHRKNEESTVLCLMDRFPDSSSSSHYPNKGTKSISYQSAFETLPVQLPPPAPIMEDTDEITNNLSYPSLSSMEKKKSFKTLLSLLRINRKRK